MNEHVREIRRMWPGGICRVRRTEEGVRRARFPFPRGGVCVWRKDERKDKYMTPVDSFTGKR